ncbi:UNVERIFIED_CONTAM: hypothetical protein K2H54_027894 [Gekko kuhli]
MTHTAQPNEVSFTSNPALTTNKFDTPGLESGRQSSWGRGGESLSVMTSGNKLNPCVEPPELKFCVLSPEQGKQASGKIPDPPFLIFPNGWLCFGSSRSPNCSTSE